MSPSRVSSSVLLPGMTTKTNIYFNLIYKSLWSFIISFKKTTQILFFFFQFQEIIFCYYFNYYLFYCFTLLLTLCVIGFICDIYFGSLLYVYFLSAVCLQFAETWQDPSRKNNNNVRRPHHPNNSLRSLKKSSKTRTLMTSYLLSV